MLMFYESTAEGKRALDALMKTGEFKNISEAISTALVNYQLIHNAVAAGQFTMESGIRNGEYSPAPPAAVDSRTAPLEDRQKPPSRIPLLFTRSPKTLHVQELPTVAPASKADFPPASWMFGQYNKFLPVKASCRALFNLLGNSPSGVPLSEATEKISREAAKLGSYLSELDDRSNRTREDAFAAAFPPLTDNNAGSVSRFATQFVGDLRQPKQPSNQPRESKFNGLPAILKFLVCLDGKYPTLALTKPGADFANLKNPILDDDGHTPTRKFDDSEIEFLLDHIGRSVPEEASAYRSIIDAIDSGANTPDGLDGYLCQRFDLEIVTKEPANDHQIKQTFLTTQRTGAISRMADLGLVAREKSGLRVTYLVTEAGNSFATQTE
jgi:hypothetical protein